MRTRYLSGAAAAAIALMGTPAYAACGITPGVQPAAWQGDETIRPTLIGAPAHASIVGMWSVTFMIDGKQWDFGYQQWHSDGTEILNSGSRPPSSENFCLGVWEKVGAKYVLNHYALSYDASGKLDARVNIKEEVVVDAQGDTYSGTFSVQIVGPTGSTVVQRLTGQVSGKRVTLKTGAVP